jgi:hypothetical protein
MYCTSESEILQSVSTVCYLPVFLGYLHYGRRALIKQSFLLSLGHLPSPVRVSRWYCLYNKDDHPFLDIPMRHHYLSPCRNMIGKTIPLMSFRLAHICAPSRATRMSILDPTCISCRECQNASWGEATNFGGLVEALQNNMAFLVCAIVDSWSFSDSLHFILRI